MKFIATLLIAAFALFGATGCSKVPAGNVGVKVYLLGGAKGVDSETLGPGRYWIGMNEDLYLYPTFTQTVVYDAGGDKAQEINFQDRDGTQLSADVGVQYAIQHDRVPEIFQKFRTGNEEITDRVLFRIVRDAVNQEGSTRAVEEIYGSGKKAFLEAVNANVKTKAEALGIKVDEVSLLGSVRLPRNILDALNAKIAAVQKAQQRENEVAQAKAEADKTVEEARGVADSTLLKAKAEAEAIRIRGDALRQNAQLVDLTLAERWDGKLPVNMYGGGAVPFINVDKK